MGRSALERDDLRRPGRRGAVRRLDVATASGDSTSFTYPVSTPVTLGETAVPTGSRAQIDCGAGPQPYAGGPFAVNSPATAGATLTCTVINTPTTTVRVIKNWSGRADSATIFVDKLGQAPLDTFTDATTDGVSVSHDYPPSAQVTLGEIAIPTGYVAFINCGNGPQDLRRYTGGPLSVTSPSTPGGVLTCTLTNARQAGPGPLVIAKKASRNVIRPPGRVTFTITVRNRGPGTARAVIMCDNLPLGLILVKAPGAPRVNGASAGELVAWDLGKEDLRRSHSRGTRRPPNGVRERSDRRGRDLLRRIAHSIDGRFEAAARGVQPTRPA